MSLAPQSNTTGQMTQQSRKVTAWYAHLYVQAHAVMEAAIAQAAQANTLAAKQEAGEDEPCP
eukprot:scaffold139989_cov19-Tisochrysis_lutea.AAC.1